MTFLVVGATIQFNIKFESALFTLIGKRTAARETEATRAAIKVQIDHVDF